MITEPRPSTEASGAERYRDGLRRWQESTLARGLARGERRDRF